MRHSVYNDRYSVVGNNFPLLTILLYSLAVTTLVCNDTKYPFRDVITEFDS